MEVGFEVAPLPPGYIYGDLAPAILDDLARRYRAEADIEPRHWVMWMFSNGCSVPVPTQIDTGFIPAIRTAHLLKQALENLSQVQMQALGETDRFMVSTTIDQLNELVSIGMA